MNYSGSKDHSADDAALGFYFQAFYALYALLQQSHDNATVLPRTAGRRGGARQRTAAPEPTKAFNVRLAASDHPVLKGHCGKP